MHHNRLRTQQSLEQNPVVSQGLPAEVGGRGEFCTLLQGRRCPQNKVYGFLPLGPGTIMQALGTLVALEPQSECEIGALTLL